MAYASPVHVSAQNPVRHLGASTSPNLEQLDFFIQDSAAMIDTALRRAGYITPVTGAATSSAMIFLRRMNAIGAACMVEEAAPVSDRKEDFCKMWETSLKALEENKYELDAPLDSEQSGPRFPEPSPSPFFSRDMEL